MFNTILGLFTGSSKWLYIALVVLGVTCVSLTSLSVSLYGDKQALHVSLTDKEEQIETLKKEHKEKLETLEKERKELSASLTQRNADIQTQNALIEQYRIDMASKEKTFKEAMAKKPKIVTDIKYIPTNTDECKDLQNIIDEYISTGGAQQ